MARTTGFEPVDVGSTSRCLRPLGDARAGLARSRGLEPRTSGVVTRCSLLLSYERMNDAPRRPGSPPAREERGSRNRAGDGTEVGVTGGARTRGLQSHILAFSPTELPTPSIGASGWSRTNKARKERRVYSALSSPLPMPMRNNRADGLFLPVLPLVAAAVAGGLFPRAVPALADRADPRTRVSSPPGAGMKKPFRRRARKGSVLIHRCAQRYRAPSPSEPVARYSDPHGNRLAWPRPFATELVGASQAITMGCIRFNITHSTPGRGGGTRTPVDAVLETAALAAELHLVKTKKPPRSFRGGLPIWACRRSFQDIDKRTSPPP